MNCLFLDIASHDGLLALVRDDSIVRSIKLLTKIRDDELLLAIETCLKDVKWSYSDLTHLACIIGPGGFTSLRMAVALINTLSSELAIPSSGIHLSDLYFARKNENDSPFLWVHATKREELFVRSSPDVSLQQWTEPTLISLQNLRIEASVGTSWAGEMLENQLDELRELNLSKATLKTIEEILPTILSAQKFDNNLLIPWYGRKG